MSGLPEAHCRNCAATLSGAYCAACGQKVLRDEDRRFTALLGHFFSELTALDGRFWRSITAMLFKPGVQSRAWIDGQRQRYVSPLALFLLANALYFLSPGLSDFDLSLHDQTLQFHSRWTKGLLEARLAAQGETEAQFAAAYALASGNVGKLLLIIHVPFMAAVLALMRRDRTIWFAEHFVVALHLFTFVMLFVQAQVLFGLVQDWIGYEFLAPVGAVVSLAIFSLYVGLTLRRTYRAGWLWSLNGTAATFGIMVAANLYVYRTVQFVMALAIA